MRQISSWRIYYNGRKNEHGNDEKQAALDVISGKKSFEFRKHTRCPPNRFCAFIIEHRSEKCKDMCVLPIKYGLQSKKRGIYQVKNRNYNVVRMNPTKTSGK